MKQTKQQISRFIWKPDEVVIVTPSDKDKATWTKAKTNARSKS